MQAAGWRLEHETSFQRRYTQSVAGLQVEALHYRARPGQIAAVRYRLSCDTLPHAGLVASLLQMGFRPLMPVFEELFANNWLWFHPVFAHFPALYLPAAPATDKPLEWWVEPVPSTQRVSFLALFPRCETPEIAPAPRAQCQRLLSDEYGNEYWACSLGELLCGVVRTSLDEPNPACHFFFPTSETRPAKASLQALVELLEPRGWRSEPTLNECNHQFVCKTNAAQQVRAACYPSAGVGLPGWLQLSGRSDR
jgi:hypothetical protein